MTDRTFVLSVNGVALVISAILIARIMWTRKKCEELLKNVEKLHEQNKSLVKEIEELERKRKLREN